MTAAVTTAAGLLKPGCMGLLLMVDLSLVVRPPRRRTRPRHDWTDVRNRADKEVPPLRDHRVNFVFTRQSGAQPGLPWYTAAAAREDDCPRAGQRPARSPCSAAIERTASASVTIVTVIRAPRAASAALVTTGHISTRSPGRHPDVALRWWQVRIPRITSRGAGRSSPPWLN